MMLTAFAAVWHLQRQASLVGAVLIAGLAFEASAADPDRPTRFVTVGHIEVVPVKDKDFTVVWPEETGNVQEAVSDPEVLSVIRLEKMNGAAHYFVTGKRIGTVSLASSYKKTEGQEQGALVYTVHVAQDVDRVNKILASYNTPQGARLTARWFGTGERVVIEGVALSRAQMTAILSQLPNKHLAREHIVLNVKYKCHCPWCIHGTGRPHAP